MIELSKQEKQMIEESLRNYQMKVRDAQIGYYPSYEFKFNLLKEIESLIKKVKED